MRRSVKLVMVGLAAYGLYAFARGGSRRSDRASRRPIGRDGGEGRGDGDTEATRTSSRSSWDEVDEASYESFPASDPPSYSRGRF